VKLIKSKDGETTEVMRRAITEFSHEVAEKLILCAGDNPSMVHIAAQCGVPYRTLRYWLHEGRNGSARYSYFAAEFDRVRSQWLEKPLARLFTILEDDNPKLANAQIRGIDWLTKKFFPQEFGDQLWVSAMIDREADGFDLSVLSTGKARDLMKTLRLIKEFNEGGDDDRIKKLRAKVEDGSDTETND
jgi:hypothetical protein